jgi:ribose 5-phosphate isomerase B
VRIAIGSDHQGLSIKQEVIKLVTEAGYSYRDFGSLTDSPVDYPDIAKLVAKAVTRGDFKRGILVCSTGIGMCIAANKVSGIRAALCYDNFCALRAREHNDANILCLGARVEKGLLAEMVNTFLTSRFEGGRHQLRLDKIRAMEG